MKHWIIFAILSIPMMARAYDFGYTYQGQMLYYDIVDGNAEVTFEGELSSYQSHPEVGYNNLSGTIIIPQTVTDSNGNNYTVTSIGDFAFIRCSAITSVSIPPTVTKIGVAAFQYCEGLTSISLPPKAILYDHAFAFCKGLTSIYIPDSVSVLINSYSSLYGINPFASCRGIISIVVADGNPYLDSRNNCNAIILTATNVLLAGCRNTVIPSTVTTIGRNSFYSCNGLTSLTIPASVTNIVGDSFMGCSGLTSIVVESGNTVYDSRNNCNAIIETATNKLLVGCRNTVIPNDIVNIGMYAFYSCAGLDTITIPASVTSIGTYAFSGCSGLTSVTIGNSVTSIGTYAFSGCSGLTSVTIPSSVTSIGSSAFSNVRHIEYYGSATGSPWGAISMNGIMEGDFVYSDSTKHYLAAYLGIGGSVTVPSSVDTIGNKAFYDCRGLTSVTIPNSVTSVGNFAFSGCSGLTSVTIPNSVTSVGNYAFSGCSGLTSVTIGNSVISIGHYAFEGCNGLSSLTLPNSVTSIGYAAFLGCSVLTSVTIPNSVTSIGSNAFQYCSGLTSVTIGNSVTSIGNEAFYNCSGLTSVTIPNSVTFLGYNCFNGCSNLSSIVLGRGLSSIEWGTFFNCPNISNIISKALVAPVWNNTVFDDSVSSIIPINIPCGSLDSYQEEWSLFTNFIVSDDNPYNYTVLSADTTMGHVSVLTEPTCTTPAVIEAMPNDGYHFMYWNDGIHDVQRTITIDQDTILTAYFAIDTHTVTIVPNNNMWGTVTVIGGDVYTHGSPCIVQAYPYQGYSFVEWSDSITANPYAFPVLGDVELTAVFQPSDGIEDVNASDITIYSRDGQIIVEGAFDEVQVFDIIGRNIRNETLPAGVYIIKIGKHPAQKVVVVR